MITRDFFAALLSTMRLDREATNELDYHQVERILSNISGGVEFLWLIVWLMFALPTVFCLVSPER